MLGKNGTGKTTIINILNGDLKPRSGECLIFGGEFSQSFASNQAKDWFVNRRTLSIARNTNKGDLN